MIGSCNLSIVISELSHWQKFCSVILFKVDKGLELDFHYAVLIFALVICQRMEGCRKPLLDAKEVAE